MMTNEPANDASTLDRFILGPLEAAWAQVVDHLPAVGTALVVLLGLTLAARLVRRVVRRVLEATPIDSALEGTRIASILGAIREGLRPSSAIASLAHLATLLLAWTAAADIVGLSVVRETLHAMLGYVPQVTSAILVVTLGGFLAGAARKALVAVLGEIRSPYARGLESGVELFLLIIVITIALDVLGVDVSLVTSNLTMILGAAAGLLIFLFGWSMRRPAEEIIANYYLRRIVRVGDTLRLEDTEGRVEGFSAIGVLIRLESGEEQFVPARCVLDGLKRVPATPASFES